MNSVTVGSLTIAVPGTTMFSSQECEKNPKLCCELNRIFIKYKEKVGKEWQVKKDVLHFTTAKSKPVNQVVPITDEAYKYFTSESCPENFPAGMSLEAGMKAWKKMTRQDRLEWHLDAIAHDRGGTVVSYEIFPE